MGDRANEGVEAPSAGTSIAGLPVAIGDNGDGKAARAARKSHIDEPSTEAAHVA